MNAADLVLLGLACHYANNAEHAASLAMNHAPLIARAKDLLRQGVSQESAAAIAVALTRQS